MFPTKPFESDGCSGFLSFFWQVLFKSPTPWEDCCLTHDKTYWMGGDIKLRKIADKRLARCVLNNGHPLWATILYIAVRIGGMWWLPFPSIKKVNGKWKFKFDGVRWGYGYNWPRYK